MFEKDKEKNMYSMLIAVGGLFTFITVLLTYAIIEIKFKNLNTNDGNIEKILNLQYAQIGGEVNYDTVLKIAELSKDKTKEQMDTYLAQLEGKAPTPTPSAAPQQAAPAPTGSISIEDLESIKSASYIEGNINADITWLEYSDLECPFCARLHNSGTTESVKAKYGDKINIVFNHFPLDFHPNALPGAQVLECAGELGGSETFYSLMRASFTSENSTKSFLVDKAVEFGVDRSDLTSCVDSSRYTDKIKGQMSIGTTKFGVTGTPGNVLINNKTGKFTVLSGALPYASFENAIDELLK